MPVLDAVSLLLSAAMAAAAGLVGALAVMRRMTLAADAISHVALPGIGAALLFGVHPMVGALAMLAFGALLIWGLHTRTRIATETIVGVIFTVSLAVGAFVTSEHELIEALFGGAGSLTPWEIAFGLAGAALVIAFVLLRRHALIVSLVSADIARTSGVSVARLDLFYLLAFGLTVALGLRYLGVLLMGALLIIPAATARRLARNLNQMFALSVAIAVFSTLAGMACAPLFDVETGPIIASIAGGMFFLSLLVPRRRAASPY
jgi:ABC-type Mn2+/Zn2+ transport system permease subunit